jgi:hypothetical protein
MGAALAFKENTAPVPGVPHVYSDLVKELREHARSLEVSNRLRAFGAALRFYEGSQTKNNHYYLIEVNNSQRTVSVAGFKQSESDKATAKYLEVEKRLREVPNTDAVLVSVDSMDSLRRAYPNYFLDTGVFVGVMEEILAPPKPFAKARAKRP